MNRKDPFGDGRWPPINTNRGDQRAAQGARQRRGTVSFSVTVILFVVWSGLIYLGYGLADVVLAWLASSGDSLIQTGKDAGAVLGVGKEAGALAENLNVSGLWQQLIGLLRMALAPLVFVLWAIGAILILVLPRILGRLIGMLTSMRGR